jgi:hypothetical protein
VNPWGLLGGIALLVAGAALALVARRRLRGTDAMSVAICLLSVGIAVLALSVEK